MHEALKQLRAAMMQAQWPNAEVKDSVLALIDAIESESDQAGFITDQEVATATKDLEETLSDLDDDNDEDEDTEDDDELSELGQEEDEDG